MNALAAAREELRAALSARCFLRRDLSSDSLFVTDYPRRAKAPDDLPVRLATAGFTLRQENRLYYIDFTRKRYTDLLASLPECTLPAPSDENFEAWALIKRLLRAKTPPEEQPLPPVRLTLLRLDEGNAARLLAELPPMLAELQRMHKKLPTGVGQMMFMHIFS